MYRIINSSTSGTAAHTYGEWVEKDADKHEKTCVCGHAEEADHAWDEGVITTPATHLAEGVKTYTCADCNALKTEAIAKSEDHVWGEWTKKDAGKHEKTCACGEAVEADHTWNDGVVLVQATHTAEGVKYYTCTDCGEANFEAIAKTEEHSYGDWKNHNDTQHKKVCACGDTVYEDHTLVDETCDICGKGMASGCASAGAGIAFFAPLFGAACLMLRKKKKD